MILNFSQLKYFFKFANANTQEENKKYIVGQHVWNLCEFKTSQSIRRMGGIGFKGVFTQDRRPKMAAHQLKKLWNKSK